MILFFRLLVSLFRLLLFKMIWSATLLNLLRLAAKNFDWINSSIKLVCQCSNLILKHFQSLWVRKPSRCSAVWWWHLHTTSITYVIILFLWVCLNIFLWRRSFWRRNILFIFWIILIHKLRWSDLIDIFKALIIDFYHTFSILNQVIRPIFFNIREAVLILLVFLLSFLK